MFIADFRRSQLAKTLSLGMGMGIGSWSNGESMELRQRLAFEMGTANSVIYSVTEAHLTQSSMC